MSNFGAAFFSLESTTILDPDGTLRLRSIPGELFAQFNPQPVASPNEDLARGVMAVVIKLDTGPPPNPTTVFRLYCIKQWSISQIAEELECANTTIHRRLEVIHKATGVHPLELRAYSPYLAKIEEQISDPRAKHISRQRLIDGAENGQHAC
jgi:predicted DNA-binding protein YlxM (UPF0122 family)